MTPKQIIEANKLLPGLEQLQRMQQTLVGTTQIIFKNFSVSATPEILNAIDNHIKKRSCEITRQLKKIGVTFDEKTDS